MNDYDSQRIRGLLESRGFQSEEDPAQADLIVLNTCSIRDKAEHKVYSQIGVFRKFKREKPELLLGVAGCMAQEHGEELVRQNPEIDLVVGPQNVYRIGELVEAAFAGRRGEVAIEERAFVQPIEYQNVARSSRIKAYVTVMEGCDYLCSFCIVPYVRGREKNRDPVEICEEVRWLCAHGWREVVLLGQTVNKYRHGTTDFAELLRRLEPTPGLRRIRFTSPYPLDFTTPLIEAMAQLPSVCEHVHIPAQSGSTRVLHKMRRRYSREEFLEKIAQIRAAMPEVALSTDLIAGFPSETESEFQETLSLLEEVRFDHIFAFAYSERPGTGAARLEDDVPEAVKRRRLNEIFALQLPIAKARNEALVGTVQEVLVEGTSVRDAAELTGRTRTNKIVNFSGAVCAPGDVVQVRILEASSHSLHGELAAVLEPAAPSSAVGLVQIG
jgi:tRNA-2-methylthio-N6-dimethylallyladenosine synthase